ncbi:DNA topoisomerase IB [Leptolyngbya sp. FACHB-261]|uniref:DNA topoisomerase IB n=1 Tax=Leptolyngbya sp. FACHB-261 TaxID=2692806 RepID=UPI00168930BA|nr:DNA topoisomerase IB [Leptolyngbya sp. FACHB-261]MBD2102917.1 DNA topoisomerase IB [Leptolyngbya sp. FACHB-261]
MSQSVLPQPPLQEVTQLTTEIKVDPVQSAEAVGLCYVTDTDPGIQRKRVGKGFSYIGPDGEKVRDPKEIKRIEALAIPPAWRDVWICPLSHGHLQATGRDPKKRKQYRYHELWRTVRDQTKFTRMIAFSEALPQLRERLEHDLVLAGLPREKVLATVVRLMELTRIRVGNEEYARTNQSFGLTTLRDQHVDISGSCLHFHFRGKSGVDHDIEISDRRLARIVKRCRDIPGYELFQYLDENGQRQPIDSGAVNDYLREITGQDFTAKDFRTWSGTILAALELVELGDFSSETQAKKNVVQAVKKVAQHLGNRPATCRKYYVHPAVLDTYMAGNLLQALEQEIEQEAELPYALRREELAIVALLKQQMIQQQSEQSKN